MSDVVIGVDPHKRSATIEVMTGDEAVLDGGRFATDIAGYRAMKKFVSKYSHRTWAVEGCNGIGQAPGDATACRRRDRDRRAAEAVSASAGVRHRSGSQDQ